MARDIHPRPHVGRLPTGNARPHSGRQCIIVTCRVERLSARARGLGLGIITYVPVVSMLGPPWHLYPEYLSEIRGAEFRVDYRWDDGILVERRTYTTPVGTVWQEITNDRAGAGSEHIRKHYITQRDDYRVVKYLVENTVVRSNEEAIRDRMRDLDGDGIVFGRLDRNPYQKCLIELAGPERFLVDLHTDPEPALELMDALSRKHEESLALALESQVEVLWQPDNMTSLMTPPDGLPAALPPVLPTPRRTIASGGQAVSGPHGRPASGISPADPRERLRRAGILFAAGYRRRHVAWRSPGRLAPDCRCAKYPGQLGDPIGSGDHGLDREPDR